MGLYLIFKILRQDFHHWIPGIPLVGSFLQRFFTKVIVDFTGCLHFRHPCELGGLGFTISLIWAQAFPFVALQYFDGDSKDIMTGFLAVSFIAWLVLNIIFFCTIDLSYLNTFFGTKTAPQYTCELFQTSNDDHPRFRAIFTSRIDYTKTIHEEVKEWVAANIDKWKRDQPDWFNIELIPDEFLPEDVLEAEGGVEGRIRDEGFSLLPTEVMSLVSRKKRPPKPDRNRGKVVDILSALGVEESPSSEPAVKVDKGRLDSCCGEALRDEDERLQQ